MQLKQEIQNQGHLNKGQLRLVARWKAPRSARHMEKNSPEYVREELGVTSSYVIYC